MKNGYWLLILLFALTARGQNFRPFRPGTSYEFSQVGSDSLYSLRLDRNADPSMSDSAYAFNYRVGPNVGATNQANCTNCRYSDNLFGSTMWAVATSNAQVVYSLVFGDYWPNTWYFREVVLRPRAPFSQVWTLNGTGGGETAHVTARGVATVLGQSDSVVTITSSTGKMWRLSKNYGLVEGPSLRDMVLRAPSRVRQLVLSAVPSRRLGTAQLTPQAIYDFQPGDAFFFNTYDRNIWRPTPYAYNYDYIDSVMTRTTSRTGDTLTYQMWYRSAMQPRGYAYTLVVSSRSMPRLKNPAGAYIPNASIRSSGGVMRDASRSAAWFIRTVWRYVRGYSYGWNNGRPDSLCLSLPNIDYADLATYAIGLGQTNSLTSSFTPTESVATNLIGYHKGGLVATEQWGVRPRFSTLTATAAARPGTSVSAVPNPFGAALTVLFALTRPQGVEIELHDAVGRVVGRQLMPGLGSGSQRVLLPTAGLAAGLYTLHLRLLGEGYTEVRKVLKAN